MLRRLAFHATVWTSLMVPALALAQAPPPAPQGDQPRERGDRGDRGDRGERGQRGNRGGDNRGRFEPGQFRERISGMIREQLGATDEEWQVLAPKVEAVMTAQRDARFGGIGFMGTGGRRGGGSGGGDGAPRADDAPPQQQSPVMRAASELRTTLDNKNASPEQIDQKLQALRDARTKAVERLQTAQKELKELLTTRQEAVLVGLGMLE